MHIEAKRVIPRVVLSAFTTVSSLACQILTRQDLEYYLLQGQQYEQMREPSDAFYENKEDYSNKNQESLPQSILFGRDDRWVLQIAYGPGWVPGAFSIGTPGDKEGLCTPETTERMTAYKELFEDFQHGKKVRAGLVETITNGAKQDCPTYFNN